MQSEKFIHTECRSGQGLDMNAPKCADSSTTEPDFADEDIEEIQREIPLPLPATGLRLDPTLYPKADLPIAGFLVSEDDSNGGIQTKHAVPKWFPKSIKKMFRVNRYGGQFTFKELNQITKYRNAMERVKRVRWKTYIKMGRIRWQLQRYMRRIRRISRFVPRLYTFRKSQYMEFEGKALRSWKRLEKLHLGLRVLDEAIDINFRQERMIYEDKLGGRLRD